MLATDLYVSLSAEQRKGALPEGQVSGGTRPGVNLIKLFSLVPDVLSQYNKCIATVQFW
jgi:hypothetical protein